MKNLNLGFSGEGGGNIIANPDDQWIYHRNTYRGKFLGTIYTDEQKAAVADGSFDDLYIGDYWTIGNFDWIIADINYWLNTGNPKVITSHLVVIPKTALYSSKMNDTETNTSGYLGSKMYTSGLNNAKTIIYTAFGENNILNHKECFVNSTNNGIPRSGVWVDSKVDLMNQIMIFGSMVFSSGASTDIIPYNYTIDKTQLALFKLKPYFINADEKGFFLRDTISNKNFAFYDERNAAFSIIANADNIGVLPAFGLTG